MTSCPSCSAKLAHDQRYCLECGARRGPLPDFVLRFLGREPGKAASAPAPLTETGFALPGPRAAAVAVMGLLSFGVLVGSLANTAAGTPVGQRIVVVTPGNAGAGGSGGSQGGSGGSPVVETTTITTGSAASSPQQQASAPSTTQPATSTSTTPSTPPPTGPTLPPVKHVFLIMLSSNGYQQAFGPGSQASYLAGPLRRQGELLENYYAVAPSSLANEIGLISGQGPTPQTAGNCPTYTDVTPGTVGADHQVLGNGCVYPAATRTLAGELTKAHHTWHAYVESQPKACVHPALGANDPNQAPQIGDPYVTWSNPFVYFDSLTEKSACAKDDVSLTGLAHALRSKRTTPSFSYIVPDGCHDGIATPCAPGAQAGLAATNTFLHTVVKEIEHSPAYKANGMIAITFDQAPQTGPYADASACCDNPTYPNLPAPTTTTTPTTTTPTTTTTTTTTPSTTTTTTTPTSTTTTTTTTTTTAPTTTTNPSESAGQTTPTGGGGEVGLLLISRYVKRDSIDVIDYFNHFSLLASIEDLFKLPRLGYAKDPSLPVFGSSVYTAYTP